MKNRSMIILMGAALCTLTTGVARAQVSGTTNVAIYCELALQTFAQSRGTTSNNVETIPSPENVTLTTPGFISEMGAAKGHTFSARARFVFNNCVPYVFDGSNSLDVSDMVSFSLGPTKIKFGKINNLTGLGEPEWGELKAATFSFNDSGPGFVGGSQYHFSAKGVVKRMVTDTQPNPTTGIYIEKDSGTELEVVVTGYRGSRQIIGKGKISARGKNKKQLGSTGPTSER